MIRALYTAATGMQAQETNIDVISNNLANVNTAGFKKSRADFQDLMYQYLLEPGAQTSATTNSPSGIQVGLGVKTAAVQKVFTQGDLASSSNPLDVAIEGDAFMLATLPDGTTAYTRSGALQLNADGALVTSEGYTIQGAGTIPPDALSITIAEDGNVSYRLSGQAAPQSAGQISAARFPNNSGLRAIGRNLYQETQASGNAVTGAFADPGFGRVQQGFIESSNVSVVDQVVSLITAQRAYEANSKGITTADDILSQAINLKR
jgi:flagellar basal-body rod protein FlgG